MLVLYDLIMVLSFCVECVYNFYLKKWSLGAKVNAVSLILYLKTSVLDILSCFSVASALERVV